MYAQVPEIDIREDWNYAHFSDPRPSVPFPPVGYEILDSLPEQDGRMINEYDLVHFGLSPAKLPPRQKPSLRSTDEGRRTFISH